MHVSWHDLQGCHGDDWRLLAFWDMMLCISVGRHQTTWYHFPEEVILVLEDSYLPGCCTMSAGK
jgi:hypothetical protein